MQINEILNIVNFIIFILVFSPLYWVITDSKTWKIKNKYIYTSISFSIILSFFITWFFQSKQNIIWLVIIILFSFLFYKNAKWWAWDWKYLILLWLNTLIISSLSWYSWYSINILLFTFFLVFLLYFAYSLLSNFKKLKYSFKKIKKGDLKNMIRLIDIWSLFLIYVSISILFDFVNFEKQYAYILTFILIFMATPIISKFNKNNLISIFLIIIWTAYIAVKSNFYSFAMIFWIFILYRILSVYSEIILEEMDTKIITVGDLKQWMILAEDGITKINKDFWTQYLPMPLQGSEVYEIIWFYKWKDKWIFEDLKIYKDIKIAWMMYGAYFATAYIIMKNFLNAE
ncbi:MAG: hypothetical protein ACD_3C00051G0007 [uncultured bacterium (gcode 4)]|uniref:Uncharacterized protein n=1 Tax=uncultured bacterium (gcode 4) TaxID=1234023 RepID=K2GE27_9BACT|nr:MAG: hypothetical protein ACD_3C00051G0007 [uncultured bacterium (gcode 4)]